MLIPWWVTVVTLCLVFSTGYTLGWCRRGRAENSRYGGFLMGRRS